MHLGVLGCGVIGLTTAIELQKEFPNAKVSVIADRFNDGTVSYVAAGIFEPGDNFNGPTFEITQKWINDSYYYWDDIRKSADGESSGIREVSAYYFATNDPAIVRNRFIEKLVPIYRRTTEEELSLCNGGWKYGSFFKTVVTENRIYLPYATKKFLRNGGEIIEQKVNSFSDIQQNFDVLMNCTGLGAGKLCNDIQVVPIRGQVMKVRAPWVKEAYMCDYDTYIIPGSETVTLGGCRHFGSYNMEVCKYDGLRIRERCYGMMPSLKNAELIKEMVGLRPHRAIVRVEPEILHTPGGRKMKLVHNYGHGSYGVTTAPGTALYAIKLARDLLSSSNVSKL